MLASIGTAVTTFVSDRIGRRAVCLIHSPILVMAGYAVGVGSSNKSVGYFGMFLVAAGVYSFNTVLLTYVLLLFALFNCQLTVSDGSLIIYIPTISAPLPLPW